MSCVFFEKPLRFFNAVLNNIITFHRSHETFSYFFFLAANADKHFFPLDLHHHQRTELSY